MLVLRDTLETIVLPRTVSRKLNLTTLYYRGAWRVVFAPIMRSIRPSTREVFLGAYAPISLIGLICVWVSLLITGFALVYWGLGTPLSTGPDMGLSMYMYMSATTFFTLGYGDVTCLAPLGRTLCVMEAGMGFGFLAVVIGYMPVLYQSFSRREATILLLDARAGSPPTACELLRRYGGGQGMDALESLLAEFERWSANLLETYLSYPLLAFYRSQHEKQTWLGALTAILDTCSIIQLGFKGDTAWEKRLRRQAELTFAMARHVAVDVAYILDIPPLKPTVPRLTDESWHVLLQRLVDAEFMIEARPDCFARLKVFRAEYEPFMHGLAQGLFLTVPPFMPEDGEQDNWQTSAWETDEHF